MPEYEEDYGVNDEGALSYLSQADEAVDPYTGLTKAQTDAQIAALLGGSVDIGNLGIVPEWEQYRAPSYSAPTMEYLSSLDKYIAQNDPSFGMMYSKAPTVDLSTPEKIRQYSLYGIGDFLPQEQVVYFKTQRRELRFRFESNTTGGDYQMGLVLAHLQPGDGTTIG